MEEFVLDLLVFLNQHIGESGDYIEQAPSGEAFENMSREDLEAFYENVGINSVCCTIRDFVYERCRVNC